ncbi:IclR family transcriptional regulator [Sphingomonas immobilis]|uniref:Helix-turn-helix domain-containing protein n=1 Tax=Sphingomonas immobilis TaxID=3063997 RepID=A0ABT8ZZI0_9SPHN|nr:helix-turn-helix domain-containing protein [Sphingomonas sp. CA1-15]MDO7842151.1 helix-turn-helix domain-containing protein [Sphingomonas sp. CA1-15]
MNQPKNYSKSANRALDVLDYFARCGRPARGAEIADALGIARSSADQLLKSMVLSGYLVRPGEGQAYFPSLRMARFGHWIAGCYPDIERYRAIVEDVHEQTGCVVTLTMRNDCFMQMMTAARGSDDDPLLDVGAKVPVLGSAIGSAALTTQSRKAIARLVERARLRHAVLGEVDWDQPIDEEIRLFRMKGYSWRPSKRVRGAGTSQRPVEYWSIAMTLPHVAGTPEIVLGLAGPTPRVRPHEWDLVNLMRRSIRLNMAH